jgi:hypothetical protein
MNDLWASITGATWWPAAISATTSAAVTLILFWLNSARADLTVQGLMQQIPTGQAPDYDPTPGNVHSEIRVTNAGDGPARDVRLFGNMCDVARWNKGRGDYLHLVPVLEAGASMTLSVHCLRANLGDATVVIRWRDRPRPFLRYRHLAVRLRDMETEVRFPPGMFEDVRVPTSWWAPTRLLSARAARVRFAKGEGWDDEEAERNAPSEDLSTRE